MFARHSLDVLIKVGRACWVPLWKSGGCELVSRLAGILSLLSTVDVTRDLKVLLS